MGQGFTYLLASSAKSFGEKCGRVPAKLYEHIEQIVQANCLVHREHSVRLPLCIAS